MKIIKLRKKNIGKHLKNDHDIIRVKVLEETTSTNDDAKKLLLNRPEEVALVATNKQTAGRGRYGKKFYSELDHGLYFSLAFTPHNPNVEEFPLYTLLSAAALVESLEKIVPHPVSIKWVNDIFYAGRKVSGILSEMGQNIQADNTPYIVMGIGINFAGDFSKTSKDVQNVAGTLFGKSTPPNFEQNEFLADFVNRFMKYHFTFHEKKFLKVYEEHLLGVGEEVFYTVNGEKQAGIIQGINNQGHLIILKEDQTEEALFSHTIEFGSEQFTNL